ncbi:hypothetical protein GPECTOR_10g929 [Gonium pectorale]|uniref:EGF-like domain-containing protein n=1 Tax=Gonium pectorale TaxID=33097 RepID=A0A150GR65_GONPE|nr:hypothetical protein GPECTOR_10g929 [Gonium pectorale]|eukprot:KXZ52297.1 hypothetical protein GPECTOR_10g929 [Gonium pectorale]
MHRLSPSGMLALLVLVAVSGVVGGRGSWVGGTAQQAAAVVRPASASGACSDACYQRATCQEELGRCDCPRHLAGTDCTRNATTASRLWALRRTGTDKARLLPCLNDCNGRGKCAWGNCVCDRGHFGSDCSVSLDASRRPVLLAGSGYAPRERRPRVYVYDIPHVYSSWRNAKEMDRPLSWVFWERLLGSGARVANGDEADWFWIPINLRRSSDGKKLMEVIDYVRQKWPWYDRFQGHRHFVIHSGDTGRGELPDLVVPVFFTGLLLAPLLSVSGLHPRAPRLNRTQTLLFAGRICGDYSKPNPAKPWPHCATSRSRGYSQGARQRVHFHHHNRTGYKIVVSDPYYGLDLLNYKWCLAPSGGGYGVRQTVAAVMGCLPLVVSDSVMQPFEPEMDWGAFSLRLPQQDIPQLHSRLQAVEAEGGVEARQAALLCAAQHLVYSGSGGAFMGEDGRWDAFEFILEVLRMRVEHPGLDPARYASVDERFRSFVHCGDTDMAAYGRKARAAALARYPTLPGLPPDDQDPTWEHLYANGDGLLPLLKRYAMRRRGKADGVGKGAGDEEQGLGRRLCSMSAWDPPPARCTAGGFRSQVAHLYVPGGAACNQHAADLSRCPRIWE